MPSPSFSFSIPSPVIVADNYFVCLFAFLSLLPADNLINYCRLGGGAGGVGGCCVSVCVVQTPELSLFVCLFVLLSGRCSLSVYLLVELNEPKLIDFIGLSVEMICSIGFN